MRRICTESSRSCGDDATIDAMTFRQITFWGGLDFVVDGWYLRRGAADYHRLFRWGPGFTYATHRPPTVTDAVGRDLRAGHWMDADTTADIGDPPYHYSLLFPKQVAEKSAYYAECLSGPIGQAPGNGLTRCTEDWNIHTGSTTSMRIRAG